MPSGSRILANCYIDLGATAFGQKDFPLALDAYSKELAIAGRQADDEPANAQLQHSLSASHVALGSTQIELGNLPEAAKSFEAALDIRQRLAKARPDSAKRQRHLSMAYAKLAGVYQRQLKIALAMETLAKGSKVAARLAAAQPDNADAKEHAAWFEGRIAALPHVKARAQVTAAFNARNYPLTAAAQEKVVTAIEKAERTKAGRPGPETATELLYLTSYRLFARDFKGALAASERGLSIQPGRLQLILAKGHALMFLGRAEEARTLYRQYVGQPIWEGGMPWEEIVPTDFEAFEKYGITHPQMAEIKTLLRAR